MENSYEYVVDTFEEIQEGYINIDKNSNYYYIKHLGKKFISLCRLNLCTITKLNGKEVIMCINDYINVLNGDLILSEEIVYSIIDNHKILSNIKPSTKIISLNKVLGNNNYKLNIDDVNDLIKNKTYMKKKLNSNNI